jgi:two-component system OmpR family sensor kinase/two-component system phosphate regulon sensor histidine kinase PhoR
MKIKYKQRIYIFFTGLFIFYTGLMVVFSLNEQKRLKTQILKSEQIVYARMVSDYMVKNQLNADNLTGLSELTSLFPTHLHVAVLDKSGQVLFDNQSQESKKEIYYYTHAGHYIVHTGFPSISGLSLKPDIVFVLIAVVFSAFVLSLFFLYYKKWIESVKNLKYFITFFRNHHSFPENISFYDDDLREVQAVIRKICDDQKQNEKNLTVEKEKLIEHFHYAEEGISFFTPQFINIYTNSHFIQHLNLLLNIITFDVSVLFRSDIFKEVVYFLENSNGKNTFDTKLYANGHTFFIQVILFDDKSFEIIIRDITDVEKNNFDKSEMTNNIAHELLTPVSSVKGYLETLMNYDNLPDDKKQTFIQRAYVQIVRLTEIIQDTVLLSKTSHTPHYFHLEEVNLYELIRELTEVDVRDLIESNHCTVDIQVEKDVRVRGNRTLLHSIFRNLGANALKYAGENITIAIHNYMEDKDFYYFSFSDNGVGVEEKGLDRIFERFYRITEGRTRDKGGSGLGLAIVKEAVIFHHGKIHVRNRAEGGLEFLFTIGKKFEQLKVENGTQ